MKKRVLFLVLLVTGVACLAQDYPFKLAIDNQQTSLTLALAKEQIYRLRVSNFYTGGVFYNLYYGLKDKSLELSTGHQHLTIAGGLVVSDAQYQDATIIAGQHDFLNYQAGITPLYSFYEFGLNKLLTLNYLEENKQISKAIALSSRRTILSLSANYPLSDNLNFAAAYAGSSIAQGAGVSQNSGTGVMVSAEYQNLLLWGITNTLKLSSYSWAWQQAPGLDPYSADLFNNAVDRQISGLKDQTNNRLTVFEYRGEYQAENTTLYLKLKTILDSTTSAYTLGVNYKVPEIAGLGLGLSVTNMTDLFRQQAGPVVVGSLTYVGSLQDL